MIFINNEITFIIHSADASFDIGTAYITHISYKSKTIDIKDKNDNFEYTIYFSDIIQFKRYNVSKKWLLKRLLRQ